MMTEGTGLASNVHHVPWTLHVPYGRLFMMVSGSFESGEKGTWCGHLPNSATAPATVGGERLRNTPLGRLAREGSGKR